MTDLSQLSPDQLNTIKGIDPTIAKWFVIIGGIVTIIQTVSSWINTAKTKKNTKALGETTNVFADQLATIKAAEDAAIKAIDLKISEFKPLVAEMTAAKNEMLGEVKKTILGIMRLNEESKKQLSMMPKVSDALSRMELRTQQTEVSRQKTDKKVDALIEGLERFKKNNGR